MTAPATPAPDPKRAKVSLAEQAEEAHREMASRYRVYSARVAAGKMTQAEADHGIATMRAIRDTLRLFARFEDEIRATLAHFLHLEDIQAEVAALRERPEVQAVLDVFEGAEVGHPDHASIAPPRSATDREEPVAA
jgi:hypothetical protein